MVSRSTRSPSKRDSRDGVATTSAHSRLRRNWSAATKGLDQSTADSDDRRAALGRARSRTTGGHAARPRTTSQASAPFMSLGNNNVRCHCGGWDDVSAQLLTQLCLATALSALATFGVRDSHAYHKHGSRQDLVSRRRSSTYTEGARKSDAQHSRESRERLEKNCEGRTSEIEWLTQLKQQRRASEEG